MAEDPYAVLGVAADADQADIRRAWVDLAHRHHPDHGGDPAAMHAVNEAWAVLGDPVRRRAWDHRHGRSLPPDPDVEPVDETAEGSEWLDPRPLYEPHRSWMDLMPVAVFAGAVATGCIALVLDEPGLLGLAAFLFFLSCLAVAAATMLSMRRSVRAGRR